MQTSSYSTHTRMHSHYGQSATSFRNFVLDFSVGASVESHSSVVISSCLDQEDGANREIMFSDAVLTSRSVSSLSLLPSCMFPPIRTPLTLWPPLIKVENAVLIHTVKGFTHQSGLQGQLQKAASIHILISENKKGWHSLTDDRSQIWSFPVRFNLHRENSNLLQQEAALKHLLIWDKPSINRQ